LLSKACAKERAKRIDPKRAARTFVAGNPLPYDSGVKEWKYWIANTSAAKEPGQPLPEPEPLSGAERRRDCYAMAC
jgi:hypothetical protein